MSEQHARSAQVLRAGDAASASILQTQAIWHRQHGGTRVCLCVGTQGETAQVMLQMQDALSVQAMRPRGGVGREVVAMLPALLTPQDMPSFGRRRPRDHRRPVTRQPVSASDSIMRTALGMQARGREGREVIGYQPSVGDTTTRLVPPCGRGGRCGRHMHEVEAGHRAGARPGQEASSPHGSPCT